jgi:hypothetical protein
VHLGCSRFSSGLARKQTARGGHGWKASSNA